MKTRVVHIDSGEDYFYIGRPGKWSNPFHIGQHGTRKECIEQFRIWLHSNKTLMSEIMELDGKVLGCHCKPKSCHGDVLVETIENKKILDMVFENNL